MRTIQIPQIKINESALQFIVQNNDDVLLSFCKQKRPKFGTVTNYGIRWDSYEDLKRDAEQTCHGFWQLLIFMDKNNLIIAPSHSDEIYNLHINPYTLEKLVK